MHRDSKANISNLFWKEIDTNLIALKKLPFFWRMTQKYIFFYKTATIALFILSSHNWPQVLAAYCKIPSFDKKQVVSGFKLRRKCQPWQVQRSHSMDWGQKIYPITQQLAWKSFSNLLPSPSLFLQRYFWYSIPSGLLHCPRSLSKRYDAFSA